MKPTPFQKYCSDFGKQVRAEREKRGFTQEDMMDLGFSLRHYQRIEAGRSVTLATLWKLASAFDVELISLLPRQR